MALWPVTRCMDEFMRDFDRMPVMPRERDWYERPIMPYWREADHSVLHVANEVKQVVNDDKKFAVSVDVSQFKPEELKVHLEGRDLTVEGRQEEKTDHGFIERSFLRKWSLPKDCDLDAVQTHLTDVGHLSIEAPKTGQHTHRRTLPIMPVSKRKWKCSSLDITFQLKIAERLQREIFKSRACLCAIACARSLRVHTFLRALAICALLAVGGVCASPPADCRLRRPNRVSPAPSTCPAPAVSDGGELSALCSRVSCAVGRLSTLASAGPTSLHTAYNFNYIQAFLNNLQQHNGVDGNWRPADGDAPANSAGAPAACSECRLLRQSCEPSSSSCNSRSCRSPAMYSCRPPSSGFIHSNISAFQHVSRSAPSEDEVQQLKSCIQTIFLVLSQNGVVGATSPVLGALPAPPTLPQVGAPPPQLHGPTRKRHAPPPPQPECPVALRPITSCPTLPSQFMPHWTWLMPGLMRPPSPTLPQPQSLETTTTARQEHEPTKWSNPSSVESNGLKTDSTAGESANIDIVGMDGSESSTSSTSTQAMLTSPAGQNQLPAYIKDAQHPIFPFPQKSADLSHSSFLYGVVKTEPPPSRSAPIAASLPIGHVHSITTPERKHRKQQNDDYVKLIREQDLSDERISAIPIPVPQALSLDPNFRAVSEQQVVQQVVQNKRFEEVDVRESMTHLCKKLAEKRVFGSKLMAETTVAGLNHSTFPNLPIEGIMYIQHVCRKVLGDRFSNDDDFWESLRDSMRKLAARCRRVRHAKKTKSSREEGVLLGGERSTAWPEGSVAQTLQSLNLPVEKPTHSVQTIPIVADRKKVADISDMKLAETLQSGLHALANATLANQTLPATLADMSSAWSLLQLHKTESLLHKRDLRSDDVSSP